jgi:hypothetical protein
MNNRAIGPVGGFAPKTAENSIQSQKYQPTQADMKWMNKRSGGGMNIRNMGGVNGRQLAPGELSQLIGPKKYM